MVTKFLVRRRFARDFADVVISKFEGKVEKGKFIVTRDCGAPIDLSVKKLSSASECVACDTLEEAREVAYDAIEIAIERVAASKVIIE